MARCVCAGRSNNYHPGVPWLSEGQVLTVVDSSLNYVYLTVDPITSALAINVNQSGFPGALSIPLATIDTSSRSTTFRQDEIMDCRPVSGLLPSFYIKGSEEMRPRKSLPEDFTKAQPTANELLHVYPFSNYALWPESGHSAAADDLALWMFDIQPESALLMSAAIGPDLDAVALSQRAYVRAHVPDTYILGGDGFFQLGCGPAVTHKFAGWFGGDTAAGAEVSGTVKLYGMSEDGNDLRWEDGDIAAPASYGRDSSNGVDLTTYGVPFQYNDLDNRVGMFKINGVMGDPQNNSNILAGRRMYFNRSSHLGVYIQVDFNHTGGTKPIWFNGIHSAFWFPCVFR